MGFTIVSSRPAEGMGRSLDSSTSLCRSRVFNGGSLLTSSLDVIEAHRLPQEAAATMLALLAQRGVDAWVYADGDWRDGIAGLARPLERLALGYGPIAGTSSKT